MNVENEIKLRDQLGKCSRCMVRHEMVEAFVHMERAKKIIEIERREQCEKTQNTH